MRAIVNYSFTKAYVWIIPLKVNKYFCMSMLGNNYGDNIKCLADYICGVEDGAIIVWGFTNEYYKKVDCDYVSTRLYSLNYYYHILTSKYILTNQGINHKTLIKRKGQIVIQTWHGTCLKKIGSDINREKEELNLIDRLFKPNPQNYYVNMTDIWISGSRFMSQIYKDKFSYSKPIFEIGTPRNDIFFGNNQEVIRKVKDFFGIPLTTQIVLYAPTFRSDKKITHYDIDADEILDSLSCKYGQDFVFITRLHPVLLESNNEFGKMLGSKAINASYYPDMQELLYVADFLVTDYSSCMFDFMYSYKPILLYLADKNEYSESRGFYFNIDSLPFLKVNSNKELRDTILNYDENHYREKITEFMERIGSVETGHATEATYNIIKGRTNNYNIYK